MPARVRSSPVSRKEKPFANLAAWLRLSRQENFWSGSQTGHFNNKSCPITQLEPDDFRAVESAFETGLPGQAELPRSGISYIVLDRRLAA